MRGWANKPPPRATDKPPAPPAITASVPERGYVQRQACACGGTCPRCQAQAKLRVSQPGDAREQEADRVADQVVRSASPVSIYTAASNGVQREVQATSAHAATPPGGNAPNLGAGQPLDAPQRNFFETRMGHDFGDVRVHTGAQAQRSADAFDANAYTVGSDIVFGAGQYAPETAGGQRLLAHELTHVVQQERGATQEIARQPRSLEESLPAEELLDDELFWEVIELRRWLEENQVNSAETGRLTEELTRFEAEAGHRLKSSERFKALIAGESTARVLELIVQAREMSREEKISARERELAAQFLEILKTEAQTRKQPVEAPTSIGQAIAYLEEAQQWDLADPPDRQRAYQLVHAVEQMVGELVWGGKVRAAFHGKALNLTYAELLCSSAYSELSSASWRLRQNQALRGLWGLVHGRMKAAREYLEVANGERRFEESPIATAVEDWKYAPLLITGGLFAAYVGIVAGGPLLLAELQLAGSAAVAAGRSAWVLYLTNSAAGAAVAEFALGAVLTIAADGLGPYLEQMTTPQGVLITVFEIMLIRQAMGGGGYRQYKGRVKAAPGGNKLEVEIIEGPTVVSGKSTTTTTETPPATTTKSAAPPIETVAEPVPVTKTAPPVTPAKDAPPVEVVPPAPKPTTEAVETGAPPAPAAKTPVTKPATPEATEVTAPAAAPKPAADPYGDLSLTQLKKRAVTDPAAAEALLARYRAMPDSEITRRARDGDAAAISERDRRIKPNTPLERLSKGHGNFSRSGVQSQLEDDIRAARDRSGIQRTGRTPIDPDQEVEGGTVGAARTDVEGLEGESFVGASPKAGGTVNPESEFVPATDPKKLPHTHAHAEQQLADMLAPRLRELPPEKLNGKTVWMLIEQEPCSTCASGVYDPNTAAGVLRKLSAAFPQLTFEIKNLNSSAILRLRGGTVVE